MFIKSLLTTVLLVSAKAVMALKALKYYEFQGPIQPSNIGDDAYFGWDVAVSKNGKLMVVSAPGYNDQEAAIWIYERKSTKAYW